MDLIQSFFGGMNDMKAIIKQNKALNHNKCPSLSALGTDKSHTIACNGYNYKFVISREKKEEFQKTSIIPF